ncbi:MAG: DNA polymerase [Methylibium sp. NZG]|nr:MAG: DNA polymerase [Methylibium sp. NZG]
MRWTDRQRAMLLEMGIRLGPEPPGAEPVAVVAPPAAEPVAVPAAVRDGAAPAAQPPAAVAAPPPATAAPVAFVSTTRVAHMDWPELRATVAGCTACRLCQGRTQTVFGVGHLQADWMIVGEAPGEQEDRQGEPFVGKSGQLLGNMLRAIGLTREDAPATQQVYIANTLKCRPPGNRNPQPDELAQCEPYLIRQVALVQPKIILAMGSFAVQSLLRNTEPIGRLRGRVHDYHGVPLIVTYHPAYLLRRPEEKARAWDDLCLAVETARQAAK